MGAGLEAVDESVVFVWINMHALSDAGVKAAAHATSHGAFPFPLPTNRCTIDGFFAKQESGDVADISSVDAGPELSASCSIVPDSGMYSVSTTVICGSAQRPTKSKSRCGRKPRHRKRVRKMCDPSSAEGHTLRASGIGSPVTLFTPKLILDKLFSVTGDQIALVSSGAPS
jgi:hypothetical protein